MIQKEKVMKIEKLYRHIPYNRLYFKYNEKKKLDKFYQKSKAILIHEREGVMYLILTFSLIFGLMYLCVR